MPNRIPEGQQPIYETNPELTSTILHAVAQDLEAYNKWVIAGRPGRTFLFNTAVLTGELLEAGVSQADISAARDHAVKMIEGENF